MKKLNEIIEIITLKKLTKAQREAIIDKTTTALLLFLFSTPVLIFLYIILWFLAK